MKRRWLAVGLVLTVTVISSSSATRAEPLNSVDIERLIGELAHRDFSVRERATQALLVADPQRTLAPLVTTAKSGPPEAAVRATEILSQFYSRPTSPATDELETAILALIAGSGSVSERASLAWDSQRGAREQRIIGRLEALGAKITFAKDNANIDVDEVNPAVPVIEHIVLGRKWRGGTEGLKYLVRLSHVQIVYRVVGANVTSDDEQMLRDVGLRVETRGAFLGISSLKQAGFGAVEIGATIDKVSDKSPAGRAGLRPGDTIVKFGDKDVDSFETLIAALLASEPRDQVNFTVIRAREEIVIPVELGEWDPAP